MLWLILYTFDSRAMRKRILPAVQSTMRNWNRQDSIIMIHSKYRINHRFTASFKRLTARAFHIYANHSQEIYLLLKSANSSTTFSNFGTHTGQISPIYLRQQPSLFFQGSSRQVNDALAYRTAIVYSRSLTRTNTDNAWVYYYGATKIIIVTP